LWRQLCFSAATSSSSWPTRCVVDQNFWGHHVYFLGLMTLLLTFVESDAALSVRALRSGRRACVTTWPILVMMIQLSLVYFFGPSPSSIRSFSPGT